MEKGPITLWLVQSAKEVWVTLHLKGSAFYFEKKKLLIKILIILMEHIYEIIRVLPKLQIIPICSIKILFIS